ncbi:glycosyltransferase family 2 protein [Thermoleptolyngbya sp.]
MNPEVSVIMPAYNTEAYIARAIASALNQTLHNIEVIVVDDASTDGTAEVARRFRDERVRVFVNEQNMGAAGARNRALRAAQGNWIAVLDSDDWYAPERLERLLQVAQVEQADMVADDLYYVPDGSDTPLGTLIQRSGHSITEIRQVDPVFFVETDIYGQQGLHLGLSKPLMRRQFLMEHDIEYDLSLRLGQDFWLYVDCLINGARYLLVPEPYYYYRFRPNSLVKQSKIARLDGYCRAAQSFLKKEKVRSNPRLVQALSHNLAVFQRNRAYYRVVEPLKQKQYRKALLAAVRNPYFFIHFAGQLGNILQRRWSYFFQKNALAYETRLSNQ